MHQMHFCDILNYIYLHNVHTQMRRKVQMYHQHPCTGISKSMFKIYSFFYETKLSFPQNVLSAVFNFMEHLWNMKHNKNSHWYILIKSQWTEWMNDNYTFAIKFCHVTQIYYLLWVTQIALTECLEW